MRLPLLTTLSLCLLAACADHSGTGNGADNGTTTPSTDGTSSKTDIVTRTVDVKDTKPSTDDKVPESPGQTIPGESPFDPGDGSDGGDGGSGPVPEPSTLLLVGTGLAGVALLRRRRKAPESA